MFPWRIQGTVTGAGSIAVRGAGALSNASLTANSSTFPTYDISFTNTNSFNTALNASSTGGARTLNAGQTVQVQDNGVSNNFRIVIGGRTIPAQAQFTSGTNLNVTATATMTGSELVASGNNDLSTVAGESFFTSTSAGGGSLGGSVNASAWYVRFTVSSMPADYEVTGVTITNTRTGQSVNIGAAGSTRYYEGPVWLRQ